MKKVIKMAIAAAAVLCATTTFAQQPKFGHVNLEEVVALMPERNEAQIKLEKLNTDYTSMLETMQVEFNNKYQELQKNAATYTDAVRQLKERELQDLQTRMNDYYTKASQELEKTGSELLAPIVKKAEDAIKKVGRDNGFLIIFDDAARPMAYYDEKSLTNVLPMVKKELGIPESATAPTAATPAVKK